jgi:predicted RNA-binding Zn-ribbon protein involved in translation (DUF1610 family)
MIHHSPFLKVLALTSTLALGLAALSYFLPVRTTWRPVAASPLVWTGRFDTATFGMYTGRVRLRLPILLRQESSPVSAASNTTPQDGPAIPGLTLRLAVFQPHAMDFSGPMQATCGSCIRESDASRRIRPGPPLTSRAEQEYAAKLLKSRILVLDAQTSLWTIWVFLTGFLLTPLAAWRSWRAVSRWRSNRCRSCGYDLRGNVSGRCPECGRRINRQILAARLSRFHDADQHARTRARLSDL